MKCFTHEEENCDNPGCRKSREIGESPFAKIKRLEAQIAELTETLRSVSVRFQLGDPYCAGCDSELGQEHGTVGGKKCRVGLALGERARG